MPLGSANARPQEAVPARRICPKFFAVPLYKSKKKCYTSINQILRQLLPRLRHMEWGETPRESVTVMPLREDKSDTWQLGGILPKPELRFLFGLTASSGEALCVPCQARGAFFMAAPPRCVSTGADGAAPGNK